jgi:hypothetical protein
MEISVDLRWQGVTPHANGSLVERDPHGLGGAVARRLLQELERIGATFVTGYIVQGVEEEFYKDIGLVENVGHLVYCRDRRPYVVHEDAAGGRKAG